MFREIRQAARILIRAPGHSAAVILLLALGIGLNAAMFSLVNALFIRELPVHEPHRLVMLNPGWPTALLEDFRNKQRSFSGILAAGSMLGTVVSNQAGEQITGVNGRVVTGNYFQVLGIQAAHGRVFTEAEDSPSDPKPVMVISHAFWRRQFDGDPKALGRQILLAGVPFSIIGIAPAAFTGDAPGMARDFWAPLNAQLQLFTISQGDARRRRTFPWLSAMGRLNPGVSLAQAQAESETVYSLIAPAPAQPERSRRSRVRIEPASRGFGGLRGQLGTPLQILAGTVVVVLLVVWANVATLLLARGAARRREMAVRLALGCSRRRLLRQLLLESLLLAATGGLLGLALAPASARALVAMQPGSDRIDLDLALDANIAMFGAAISVLTALAFGLLPALRASRTKILPALNSASWGSTAGRQKTIRSVIIVQVALSVILVAASILFTRSLAGLHAVDTGFDRQRILSVTIDPGRAGYRDPASQGRLAAQLMERLSAVPGVKSASVGLCAVLMGCSRAAVVSIESRVPQADDPSTWINPVSPDYFETVGIPIAIGRSFGSQDRPGSMPVAIVTEAFARFYFPGQTPIGKRFAEPSGGNTDRNHRRHARREVRKPARCADPHGVPLAGPVSGSLQLSPDKDRWPSGSSGDCGSARHPGGGPQVIPAGSELPLACPGSDSCSRHAPQSRERSIRRDCAGPRLFRSLWRDLLPGLCPISRIRNPAGARRSTARGSASDCRRRADDRDARHHAWHLRRVGGGAPHRVCLLRRDGRRFPDTRLRRVQSSVDDCGCRLSSRAAGIPHRSASYPEG